MTTNPKPEEPLESDCCGQGCVPCVKDIYEQELARWEKRKEDGADMDRGNRDEMSDNEYVLCTLTSIVPVTGDTQIYQFSLPQSTRLTTALPGQHLILQQTTENGNSSFTRQFTILTHDARSFKTLIKTYRDGRMSRFICDWKVGESVPWRGPLGVFRYSPGSFKQIVAFAMGTGIVPILSVVESILKDEDDETMLDLHFGFKDLENVLLIDNLSRISDYWNVTLTLHLSRQTSARTCRFSKIVLDQVCESFVKDVVSKHLPAESCRSLFLVCGTKAFESSMIKWIGTDSGIPRENIFKF